MVDNIFFIISIYLSTLLGVLMKTQNENLSLVQEVMSLREDLDKERNQNPQTKEENSNNKNTKQNDEDDDDDDDRASQYSIT